MRKKATLLHATNSESNLPPPSPPQKKEKANNTILMYFTYIWNPLEALASPKAAAARVPGVPLAPGAGFSPAFLSAFGCLGFRV